MVPVLIRYLDFGPRISFCRLPVYVTLAGAMILVACDKSFGAEALVFRDSEDLILDGAPDGVDSYSPAVAVNGLDQIAIVWNDNQEGPVDTLMGLFSRSLESIHDIVFVNETFVDTDNRNPRVAAGSDNTFTIVWSDNRSIENLYDVFVTRIDSTMKKLFDDTRLNEPFQDTNVETPDLASLGEDWICVCWVDNRNTLRDIYARRLMESGRFVDSRDFVVNPQYEGVNSSHPRVSGDAEATAVIVWSDDRLLIPGPPQDSRSDIYARILPRSAIPTASGDWPGPDVEIQVSNNDRGTDDAVDPDIAGNGHGLYVVAWRNQTSDGTDSHIYASVITSSGERLREEFQVDQNPPPAFTSDPAVSFVDHDVFLISWFDGREGGLAVGRLYDAAADRFLSSEFVITDFITAGARPATAPLSERTFVTTWAYGGSGDRNVIGNIHFWDLLGDLNVDARVSAQDLYILAGSWQPKVEKAVPADLDGDGFVDEADLRVMGRELGTNLADREPLTFSAASLMKRPSGRRTSLGYVKSSRPASLKPPRGDQTKPTRRPVTRLFSRPNRERPAVKHQNHALEQAVEVRLPRPSLAGGMDQKEAETVQTIERSQPNRTAEKGMFFFAGKWR